jgi:hypothetical protein
VHRRRQGAVQRLVVHPADHQHLAGVVLLRDGDDQAVPVPLELGRDGGVEQGGTDGGSGRVGHVLQSYCSQSAARQAVTFIGRSSAGQRLSLRRS